MTTLTVIHGTPSAPRLTLHGLWGSLRGRFVRFTLAPAPAAAGPLGQSATALYARGMLGWRG